MDTDPAKRRSRLGWPDRTQETTTAAGTHDHKLPQGIFRVLIALCVFLIVLAVVDAVLVVYIIGRGQVREQQIEQTRQDVRQQLCDVLDGLPQGGVLDLTRDKLHCGPGTPLESFPPEIQQQLRPTPTTAAPTATEQPSAPPVPSSAASSAPVAPTTTAVPAPPPGATGPSMSPAEPPPLAPASQVLCDVLRICPQGAP